ncbi:MAG: hypothetical protein IJV97_00575 [Alphaproteobacteria bacterium]|nr:hypothetical protein [Alphaproteobacteria bacterium]
MSSFHLRNHIQNLHQQINRSVDKITQRSSQQNADYDFSQSSENSFYYNNYRVEGQHYKLLSVEVNWSLHNHSANVLNTSQYASSSYTQASNVIKEPTVLIDYIFPNNKEFDFKV